MTKLSPLALSSFTFTKFTQDFSAIESNFYFNSLEIVNALNVENSFYFMSLFVKHVCSKSLHFAFRKSVKPLFYLKVTLLHLTNSEVACTILLILERHSKGYFSPSKLYDKFFPMMR